jgi:hypothetical protein
MLRYFHSYFFLIDNIFHVATVGKFLNFLLFLRFLVFLGLLGFLGFYGC